jgi:hypothetical protein
MSILLFAALITSSPYPFEVGSGFVVEPTLGYVFNDKIDREKLLGGVRLSYLRPDPTDALIAPELSISSATTFRRPKDSSGNSRFVTNTDYFFEAGLAFYEIYNPYAFRVACGGGVESRVQTSADLFIRGGLGYYFSTHFGFFMDLGGRYIFRRDETNSTPIDLGSSLQMIF